jgi:hypothetical protein
LALRRWRAGQTADRNLVMFAVQSPVDAKEIGSY